LITIEVDRCDGCGICVGACPEGAISMIEGVARIDSSGCTDCEACIDSCPQEAIGVPKAIVARKAAIVIPRDESLPRTTLVNIATAAIGFLGRYLVPCAVDALVDALERRSTQRLPTRPMRMAKASGSGDLAPGTDVAPEGGHRHRYRGGT
jgi:NAD-dependent dihydropyrimidine dehydrogenase PreA subunit